MEDVLHHPVELIDSDLDEVAGGLANGSFNVGSFDGNGSHDGNGNGNRSGNRALFSVNGNGNGSVDGNISIS
jgi:hypothetical protein